jgi:hypothetical protein
MKLGLALGSLLLVAGWPHCRCSAAVQLASVIAAQTDGTDEVILTVGAPLASRPWLGCGYDVLAIDFAEAEQPLVASTFKKRWADANASWARMVDVRTWWKMNESQYAAEFNDLFRDTTNTTLFWTQWAEGQWAPTGGLPDPRNATAVSAWAAERAAFLQSMVVGNEVSNLEYYCFSNEEEDVGFPKKGYPGRGGNTSNFITYNRAVRNALDDLGGAVAAVKLVGTDFFPCESSLDGVKGEASIDSYDCHHYGPEGYTDFTEIIKPPLAISRAANKNFFLSEFGGPSCAGKLAADCHPSHPASGAPKTCKDSCAWFDTPDETQLGIVLAEKVLATINNGGQSTGYWCVSHNPPPFCLSFYPSVCIFVCLPVGARPRSDQHAVTTAATHASSGPSKIRWEVVHTGGSAAGMSARRAVHQQRWISCAAAARTTATAC